MGLTSLISNPDHQDPPLIISPLRDEEEVFDLLAPFSPWTVRSLPDPREAPVTRVADGFLIMVRAEGPILDHRAYKLYTRASGLGRASRDIRSIYEKATQILIHSGRVHADRDSSESGPDGPDSRVFRMPETTVWRPRERGDRTLEEIPLGEITALIRKLELTRGEAYENEDERFRRVLEVYDLLRLTAKSKARLKEACARANLPNWSGAITVGHEAAKVSGSGGPRPRKPRRRLRHG